MAVRHSLPTGSIRVMAAVAGSKRTVDRRRLAGLTQRERELLTEVATGRSNDEIAKQLCLSPATTRTYVSRLLTKLDVRDRAQLVHIAYETGLVQPGSVANGG